MNMFVCECQAGTTLERCAGQTALWGEREECRPGANSRAYNAEGIGTSVRGYNKEGSPMVWTGSQWKTGDVKPN